MVRVVDLSHRLSAGNQRFKLELAEHSVEEYLPQYRVPVGEWYIMQDLEVCTHVGTHVESPYHALRTGPNIADLGTQALIGRAAVVDFTDKRENDPILAPELVARGAHIRESDIVLIRTGLSKHYGTPMYRRPYVTFEAIEWLVERKIRALGVDCSGIENRQADSNEANHRRLLSENILIVEDLNNLDKLTELRCFFIALTLPIDGLDASMIRPLAVEPEEAGEKLAEVFLSPSTSWAES